MIQKIKHFFKREEVKEVLLSALVALVGIISKANWADDKQIE